MLRRFTLTNSNVHHISLDKPAPPNKNKTVANNSRYSVSASVDGFSKNVFETDLTWTRLANAIDHTSQMVFLLGYYICITILFIQISYETY